MSALPAVWSPSDLIAAALNVAAAVGASFATGYWAHRLPPSRLERDGPVLRIRRFEARGVVYQRWFGVRRWKDRLPEAGAFFPGGRSKRTLAGSDPEALRRFVGETRRAERAHWAALAVVVVVPALWNRPLGVALMTAYAVVVNGPCIIVQRFNRARLESLLRRGDR